tara:strand:- start:852 stop:1067 length:216 start_codon:yes stop_codon:yes gene_type:complete
MIKRLLCSIFGHAPLRFHVLNNFPIIQVKDSLNEPLIAIDCCERCKRVYWEYELDRPPVREVGGVSVVKND